MDPFGTEKGTPIRMPSTANLMVSSYDRTSGLGTTAGNFGITAPQALLNGYFTRIAATELALNYNVPNISAATTNNVVVFDISGVGLQTVTLADGNYSVADILDTLVAQFNATTGGGRSLAVSSTGFIVTLTMTGGAFRFPVAGNNLIFDLGFTGGGAYATSKSTITSAPQGLGEAPSEQVQPILYLDFVSDQLTYNQMLKDATTDTTDRNVLVRFYMNYDNDMNQVDKYGFPLRLGMKPFYVRRTYTPPKQIKWYPNQPIGQLTFQVYATYVDGTNVLFEESTYNWAMTLQVSEV